MILVNRKFVSFLMVFTTALLGSGGYASWHILMRAYGMGSDDLKFLAEQVLFVSILGMIVNVAVFVAMIGRSHNFSRELAKQVRLSRSGNYSPDSALRKLGKTGTQIADILYEMNALSEKKSLKIGSLHALSDYLLGQTDRKMLVLSATGVIQYAGEAFLRETGLAKNECVGKNIGSILKMPNVAEEIRKVFETGLAIHNEENDYEVSPVSNHKRSVVFATCVFSKKIVDFIDDTRKNAKKPLQSAISDLFGKGLSRMSSIFAHTKKPKDDSR